MLHFGSCVPLNNYAELLNEVVNSSLPAYALNFRTNLPVYASFSWITQTAKPVDYLVKPLLRMCCATSMMTKIFAVSVSMYMFVGKVQSRSVFNGQ